MPSFARLKRETVLRGRFTPAGRALLHAGEIASQPLDYYARRRVAARYNEQFPSGRMAEADGYAVLPAGSLPGTSEVVEVCRTLFAVKKAAIEASAPKDQKTLLKEQKKKKSFLRDLLDDEDLRANPILVDFALTDPLFSTVTNYLGVVPSLTRVDLVYSVPRLNPDEHISSQLFHQDPEGLRQAKVFLNVFDVEEPNGPFTFIPARESERLAFTIREERRRAGGKADDTRYRDEELDAHGGLKSTVRLTGPTGSAVVLDTSRCLHAGSRVRPGYFRLCLFIQYCTTREKAQTFDGRRFRNDPVKWLAVKRYTAGE